MNVRMKKFKMKDKDQCPRCGQIETTKHLLWECKYSQEIWKLYNNLMEEIKLNNEVINSYEKVFTIGLDKATCLVKIKIIQKMIQIERPKNWNKDNVQKTVSELMKIELYNAKENRSTEKFEKKWKLYL